MVAPSAAPNDPERIRFAIDTVESLGFKVKPGAHLFDRDGYLAGSDAARADDLNAMFADDGVDAIWCVRGGYGASRILPALDYALMQRKPKALIGYSDITALHMAIHRHVGLVTFHGPVAFRAFTPYSLGEIKRVLWTPQTPVCLGGPPPFPRAEGWLDAENRVATLVPGRARGRLLGGNLCLMSHLCGTPYFPDLRGAILFLEDVEEAYYRIDRMLTQLWLSGALAGIAGVAFGKFTNCDPSAFFLQNRPLEEILAELDADAGTLTLLEPGVS